MTEKQNPIDTLFTDEQKIQLFDLIWPEVKERIISNTDSLIRSSLYSSQNNNVGQFFREKARKFASELYEQKKDFIEEKVEEMFNKFLNETLFKLEDSMIDKYQLANFVKDSMQKNADKIFNKIWVGEKK